MWYAQCFWQETWNIFLKINIFYHRDKEMIGEPSCGYFKSLKFLGWLVKMCSLVDKVILYHLQRILNIKKREKNPNQNKNPQHVNWRNRC